MNITVAFDTLGVGVVLGAVDRLPVPPAVVWTLRALACPSATPLLFNGTCYQLPPPLSVALVAAPPDPRPLSSTLAQAPAQFVVRVDGQQCPVALCPVTCAVDGVVVGVVDGCTSPLPLPPR